MATPEALRRASRKYDEEKIERIPMRVPKGKKEIIQAHAASQGESVNAFLNRAVDEAMKRDKEK
jgi:predicted HicB family RNase H-like nuclease